ncbi:MAG: UDP-N-acetylmuramoyl-tripeptide--D-alanyl-D-alanine ligase [Bdellovibrionia bacterium]
MRQISLAQIQEALEQSQITYKIVKAEAQNFKAIGTDTRLDLSGNLFIALVGEAFDAHDFIAAALEKGASGILTHKKLTPELQSQAATIIEVPDTLLALQALGRWARRQFKGKVIGITGSNGKTTCKEFTAAVAGKFCHVHYNKGSFNNHWGVPFTLLQIPSTAEVAVIEMGMNHAGEITQLSSMVEADVVVCTTVGRAHIEHFGTVEKIAAAKEEIYVAAKPTAKFVFNLDNIHTFGMCQRHQDGKRSVVTFSSDSSKQADVQLQIKTLNLESLEIEGVIQGKAQTVAVPVFGAHNVINLMAAASLALAIGLNPEQVWQGLSECKNAWGRNQLLNSPLGAKIVFDAYNANPDSMKALLENVSRISDFKKKVGVFGEMLEMGEQSGALHFELGQVVAKAKLDTVFFIGKPHQEFKKGLESESFKGQILAQAEFSGALAEQLGSAVGAGDLVVFKGSRGMKLERFLSSLNVDLPKS